MVAAELMGSVYWRLLRKLEAKKFKVFDSPPECLSKQYKLMLTFLSWIRHATGSTAPSYGKT